MNVLFIHGIGVNPSNSKNYEELIRAGFTTQSINLDNFYYIDWQQNTNNFRTNFKGETLPFSENSQNNIKLDNDAYLQAVEIASSIEDPTIQPNCPSNDQVLIEAYFDLFQGQEYEDELKTINLKLALDINRLEYALKYLLSSYSSKPKPILNSTHIANILTYFTLLDVKSDTSYDYISFLKLRKMHIQAFPKDLNWNDRSVLGPLKKIKSTLFNKFAPKVITNTITSLNQEFRDILTYFTDHQQHIKQQVALKIENTLSKIDNNYPTIVIAHSLGGIIMGDLLFENYKFSKNIILLTVGTQIGTLTELGMISSLDAVNTASLPNWYNFYSPNDYLSSKIHPILEHVVDIKIVSSTSFSQSHSEYFTNDEFYKNIQNLCS